MKQGLKSLFSAIVLGGVMLSGAARAEDPMKVGFVYVGPVGDHGWSYQHDQGRKAIEAHFGDKVKTTFVESVKEGPDAERVIRQLAASGHKLIFTTSFGFMNATLKVAKKFPNVKFEHATGYKRAANVSTYSARFYEGRAIIGHIAGRVSKTGVIGYIASFPIPEVVRGINAFTIALRRVNPKATVKVIWVNTWYDPGKEANAAKALIDQGADIIVQHTDSPAPLQVAEKRGVKGFGQASNMIRFAPKAQMTAIIDNWKPYYIARTQAVMDGSWTSVATWDGIKAGMVKMAAYTNMPEDVKKEAMEMEARLASGEMHAFDGPVKGQDGKELLKKGEHFDDKTLATMNFYVEGVQGKLPK